MSSHYPAFHPHPNHSDPQHAPIQLDYSPANPHPHQRRVEEPALPIASPSKRPAEDRIPRPRNAFMIYRSAFWAQEKIKPNVEHDHRLISRIIGHCWKKLSEAEKDVWRHMADREKVEHELKHPGYRFSPIARKNKPVKRRVKRNGVQDLRRCEQVAELLLSGKQGEDLAEAVKSLEPIERTPSPPPQQWSDADPPFRSPLLPPASLPSTPIRSSYGTTPSPTVVGFPRTPTYPVDGYSPSQSPVQPTPPQHIMVYRSPSPAETLVAHEQYHSSHHSSPTVLVAPLAYAVYEAQCKAAVSLDRVMVPLDEDGNEICTGNPIPPLPEALANAKILSEPVQWNTESPFSS